MESRTPNFEIDGEAAVAIRSVACSGEGVKMSRLSTDDRYATLAL